MTLEEIKSEALNFVPKDVNALRNKVMELRTRGVSFLGCVAFVQANQNLSLSDARQQTLDLDVWTDDEQHKIDLYHNLMMRELDDPDE
ncbi:hypothetical protein [Dawidia soli]|uniref:Uncharacterized protein n=1 Tax=Dawidia soli TaxID=2782352 RepID=A0AAP2GCY9_9BACT|nr:hypothetical protein [Dawidia soli]MBT1686839.1 hypothetical protein [Dawidia soli]